MKEIQKRREPIAGGRVGIKQGERVLYGLRSWARGVRQYTGFRTFSWQFGASQRDRRGRGPKLLAGDVARGPTRDRDMEHTAGDPP